MIIYHRTKAEFRKDVFEDRIAVIVEEELYKKTSKRTSDNEFRAFRNSLGFMERVLNDPSIPDDAGISIEYHIPHTAKRIDFIIAGSDGKNDNIIIVELKQWQHCETTIQDGIVKTLLGGHMVNTTHPSYQAYSYACLLKFFSAAIEDEMIGVYPCAYLHNYSDDGIISNNFYDNYIREAPLYFSSDALKLRNFIKKHIKKGDKSNIVSRIDNGKIRPSKTLSSALRSIFKGNREFIMIEEQKVVFERAKELAFCSTPESKNVFIVKGGAGTGKSVVAINLLVDLIQRGQLAQYVTKTSAPREVYFEMLCRDQPLVALKKIFVGSGSFVNAPKNSIRTLVVDEAHRLTEKTGFLKQGDNQIREIISTSLCSIFFIDEDQRVHIDDYGTIDNIRRIAQECGSTVTEGELGSQFRCNGADGYLAWLDNVLSIRETANYDLSGTDYDFRIYDSASELRDVIFEKNKINNKARLVAGYCWDWVSDKDPNAYDIVIPEDNFRMKWNLKTYGSKWIIDPTSINEVGCIHTCQGLVVDYIGVIIGSDLIVRNGVVLVNPAARSTMDRSIFGWKKLMMEDKESAKRTLRAIIKNTYKTLMTRGMKGCYIYCTDMETREYFKKRIGLNKDGTSLHSLHHPFANSINS